MAIFLCLQRERVGGKQWSREGRRQGHAQGPARGGRQPSCACKESTADGWGGVTGQPSTSQVNERMAVFFVPTVRGVGQVEQGLR